MLFKIYCAFMCIYQQTYGDKISTELMEQTIVLDSVILWIFVFECVAKIFAEGVHPHKYFLDPWNLFDFVIVALGFAPFGASAVSAVRLIRILRVFKLVKALPELQMLVVGLANSISSITYVSMLMIVSNV